jgi:hypothetical protein
MLRAPEHRLECEGPEEIWMGLFRLATILPAISLAEALGTSRLPAVVLPLSPSSRAMVIIQKLS